MSDDQIKKILKNSKTIAMIGVSSEKKGEDPKNLKRKPANVVMKYMQDFGYKVIPINPFAEGEIINGEKVIRSLQQISEPVDIVDVFRPSKETPGIANEATFATPGVNIGLFCSTPMVAVSRKISRKRMMKMLLTGEPIMLIMQKK